MPYTVALPDGRTVEFPDSVSREEAAAIIRRQLGGVAQPKESTIFGEIARGGKQLLSTSRTGIGALASPEEAARAGVERSQQIAAEAGEGPSFAALRKVYEERGLLPAAGELVSQIPRAVAGQLPQLAALAGGAKLGAMAGTAVLPGPGTIAGGVLGAGATLLPQFFGANVERQAAEQMERGEQVKIDRGAAAAAAAGQAGIEAAGTALVLGKRVVKGILGVADDAGLATAKARADLVKAAERSRLGAAGRGAAVGVAEIPVEIAQAVIERRQAGLDVMSPEAFTEYGENAYLAGLVGPTIGAATRVTEPGAARRKLAVEEQTQAAEARAAAAKAEAERKKDPAYALKLGDDYQAAVERMKELQAAVPKRPAKDALPEEQMAYREAVDARNAHLKDVLQPLAAEYVPRKAEIAQLKEQQRVAGMSEEEYADYAYEQALKRQPKTAPIAEKPEELSADFADIAPPTPAPKPAPELAYAQRQVQLANDNEAIDRLDTKDQAAGYVSYLMQDPEMARRLVTAQTPIPGVKKGVSNSILGGLKLQLKDYDAQQAATRAEASEALRQRQLMAPTAEQEEAAYLQEQALDTELRAQEAETMRTKVSPELAALQRIAARPTPGVREGNVPLSSLVDRLVEATQPEVREPSAEVKTAARVVAGTPDITTLKDRQVLQNQLSYARAVGDKTTVATVQAKLDAMGEMPEGARGELPAETPTTRIAGVERPLSPGAQAANVLTRMSQAQLRAFEDLKTLLERIGRASPEAMEPLRSTVNNRVELAKRNVIGAALNELDARRQALGQPALNPQEATQLVGRLNTVLDELASRSSRFMERPAVEAEAAQMRGTRVVRGATEAVRPPVGERAFTNFEASATALRTDMRDAIEEVFGAPPATPAERRPETRKFQRAVTPEGQKALFLTYAPTEEPEPYVEDLFARAYDRKDLSEEDRALLDRLDAVYSVLPAEEQRLVSEQVGRVANGRGFDAQYELDAVLALGEGLKRPISEEAKAEQGQRELFAAQTIDDEARGINARLQALDALIEKERSTTSVKGLEQLGTLTGREARLQSLERQRSVLQARLDMLPADKRALMTRQRELAETTRTVTNLRGEQRVQTGEGFIRATPEEFQRFLRSKKALELRLKEAAAQAARAEKATESTEKATETELPAAENLELLLAKAKDATETATIIRMYIEERLRPMIRQEDALTAGLLKIDEWLFGGFEKQEVFVRGKPTTTSRRKTEEGLFTKYEVLETRYRQLVEKYRTGIERRNTPELTLLASGIPQQLSALKPRVDLLRERRADIAARLDRAIEMRRKIQDEALNSEATVKAFAEEKQAVDAYNALKQMLSAQTAAANAKLRGTKLLEAERARETKKASPLAEIEQRVVGTTRVFRDTNAPEVRAAVAKEKRTIALNEAQLEATQGALDNAKREGNAEDVAAYEEQIKGYARAVAAAQERMYDVLNRAPLKRVTPETEAEARRAEEQDTKERQTVQEQTKALYKAAGLPAPSLPASYRGPVVTPSAGAPGALRTGSAESRAGKTTTPTGRAPQKEPPAKAVTRAKEAAPVSDAVERFAKAKAEIAALNERIKVVTASAPTTKDGVKKKKALLKQLNEALGEQGRLASVASKDMKAESEAFYGGKREYKGLRGETERAVKGYGGAQKELAAAKEQLAKLKAGPLPADASAKAQQQRKKAIEGLTTRVKTLESRLSEYEAQLSDVFFSRGTTESPSTTASVRTELSKAFPDLGRVQIYDSVDALVAANPQYEGRIPSDARGFVDTAGNKAFLIAENINKGDALAVLLHEVGAHIGLKNMLGTAQYNALVKAVETWAKKNDGSVESRVAKTALERVEAAKTPANQKADETLAYAIEEAVKAGVKPMETKGVLGQWLSQIATLFRKALEKFGLPPKSLDAQGLVDMAFGAAKLELALFDNTFAALSGTQKPAAAPKEVLFSRNLPTASRVADSLVAKEKGWVSKLKDNFLGMGGRTQFVDKLAPSEEALKRGGTDPTKALQAMYYLRMYDQRMHFTSQSITEGVPELVEKTRRDGTTERLIETKAGANIQQIVDILKGKDVVKAAGSADATNKLFTLYLAAIRGERVGYDKLNFKVSEADIKAARAEIEADPTLKKAFDEARDIYNQYNRNLLEFSVQTGALSRAQANEYLRNNDYIPYYRMRDGVAEMVIGNETPIRIGNLKDSPHLKELVGGDEAIFDFLTSSVQNTSMLLDMATKNLATKNLMFELRDVGLATVAKVPKSGKTPEGAVTFKRDGEDHYAVVDTDTIGIDSDLLVKGLAGIPTMFPAFVRVLGVPARLLRRAVVASPVYMARQLFRDSLGATMTSGANIIPLLSALNQIGKPNALRSRGITGGQVFTGMPEDVTRMLKDMQAGKLSVTNGLSYLEAKAAQVDALTRKAQYDSYLAQGLSEMEATYMALESMNFSKRGLSPTMHMASTLIPFFNAQIQGLDVLYKSFTGQMPLNERLDVRQKLWERGLMLAGLSVAYAMYMQDDETYENAKPEEKYGNWFVRVPGFEQMVRLPIPFELGYIFKALPEALVNIAMNEKGGEEAMKAFKHIAQQMVPGASSYFIPQAVKPALEALAFETSLYTGRSIESAKEQEKEPGYRARESTTALAREVGELTGFSPIKMEYLIRGYTGGMGMALLAALSAPFGKEGPEAATKRASDLPVVGTLFQPKDASGIIDATYERMKQVNQVKETYEGLLEDGRQADADKYLKENIDEMALASVAGSFKQFMGQITEHERQIRASNMTPEKKREALEQARQAKIKLASAARAVVDKKAPQVALA